MEQFLIYRYFGVFWVAASAILDYQIFIFLVEKNTIFRVHVFLGSTETLFRRGA